MEHMCHDISVEVRGQGKVFSFCQVGIEHQTHVIRLDVRPAELSHYLVSLY